MSPRDQLVNVEYGNDAVDTWQYGPANGQMSAMMSAMPGLPDLLADQAYDYDEVGNLVLQTNYLTNVEEQFNYDLLHRLTSRAFTELPPPVGGPGGPSAPVLPDPQPKPFETPEGVNYQYDALGNITGKSDYASNYEYLHNFYPDACPFGINGAVTPGPHAVTRVSTINRRHDGQTSFTPRRMAYDANGNMICSEDGNLTVQYDAFNLPTNIQRGFVTQNFNYGPDLQRYRQLMDINTETLYIDKLYERKDTIERYYLGGYLVIERDSAGIDTHSYTHKDRLGSTVAITDDAGDLKAQQGFGAFGKARDEFWEAQDALPGKAYDSRGFTDHEHLDNTRLIHMNGRAYDYNLGRFLSVDPIIQFPSNSQSLNPYSYLMNNPMAGTDPTGYACEDPSGGDCGAAPVDAGINGEEIVVEGSVTGSRIKQRLGTINTSTGTFTNTLGTTIATFNGSPGGSTTNTGSGPSGGGQQGIASLGAPGQAGNQDASTPKSQGDGVGCTVPLKCAGNSTSLQSTNAASGGATERGFLDRAAEFGGNVLDGAITGFRFTVFDFKEPLGGSFLLEGATLIPIFKAAKFLKFFRGASKATRGIDDVVSSASRVSRAGSQESRALQALRKKIDRGNDAFSGLPKTQEAANDLIRQTLGAKNPIIRTRTRNGQTIRDVFDPATGRGVRTIDGEFDTFVNLK